MNPFELQNAYFRSEAAHALSHIASIHNELAQRHLAQRLEEERHNQATQVQDVEETEHSAKLRDATDDNNGGQALPGRRYKMVKDKNSKVQAVIQEGAAPGHRLDIIV